MFRFVFVLVEREMDCLKVMASRETIPSPSSVDVCGVQEKKKVYFRGHMGELDPREQPGFSQGSKEVKTFTENEFIGAIAVLR